MTTSPHFTEEQKHYLEGFFVGASKRTFVGQATEAENNLAAPETVHGTPVDELSKEELIKYEQNGLDIWDKMVAQAKADAFPDAADMFRYKFFGLFHVKPAQDAFMLRCRIPGGILKAHQLVGLAEIAEDWGGDYADLTTRGNFQVRQIMPRHSVLTLMKLRDLGLSSQGTGADNIRNITITPTSGFDPNELIDVCPFSQALNHYILNNRDMFGLPRKFNISFDNGGSISACSDTNDIAFQAVKVGEGHSVKPGVYFRVELCGITGHKQFASDSGILIEPSDCVEVSAAMIRVFLENGDRTNRKKARLKYLVDRWGIPKFLEEVEKKCAQSFIRFAKEDCEPRVPPIRHGHFGVYPQKQAGLSYIGVVVPVGRMSPPQMKAIAKIANCYGQGEVRLTVWQNLIIPHIENEKIETVKQAIIDMGFNYETTHLSGGLVACTGNAGCKFAASNTKSQARILTQYLEERIELDQPINIHVTGCHHSCAQHYVGDIGLIGAKVKVEGETKEGYNVVLGGGVDNEQAIGKAIFHSIVFEDIPPLIESILTTYQSLRTAGESFTQFTQRHSESELTAIFSNHVSA